MTYAFTIAELRHHDVKALPDGAEYTGNQFAPVLIAAGTQLTRFRIAGPK
jgi:hypothetical protein